MYEFKLWHRSVLHGDVIGKMERKRSKRWVGITKRLLDVKKITKGIFSRSSQKE